MDPEFDTNDPSKEDLLFEQRDCDEDDDDDEFSSSFSSNQSDGLDQEHAAEASSKCGGGMENAKTVKLRLYQKCDYNLIAAATPRQTAKERLFHTSSIHGALSHYLPDTLRELRSAQYDATY